MATVVRPGGHADLVDRVGHHAHPLPPVGDTVFAAAFLLRGMASALGRVEALSHWVASDHFEELGKPPEH